MAAVSAERRRIVVAAAVALTSIELSGVAFAPALLTYSPLLLIGLSAIPRHLVLASVLTDPTAFMIVGTARRMFGCTVLYFVGETFGETGLEWLERRYPKARGAMQWFERVFRRFGSLVLIVTPFPPLSLLAGNVRMPLSHFLPAVSLGQWIWVALTYWLGDSLRVWMLPFIGWLGENMVSTTLACVVAVAAYQLLRWRRQRNRAERAVHGATEP